MKREQVKALIELSNTVEEADEIILREGLKVVREKIAFLKGLFDFTLIGRPRKENLCDEMDYYLILNAIINAKWEA